MEFHGIGRRLLRCALLIAMLGSTLIGALAFADTSPPVAPSNLVANIVSATQINLSWTASTDDVGVTGYKVERCTGASCTTFAQIGTPATASTVDTGRTAATTYRYRVRANDAAGNLSGYSNIINATTLSDTTAPTAPTNLAITVASSTQLNLSWSASTDNVGVTGYRIERCTGSTCTTFTQVSTSTTTTFNNTGLTASTTYRYRVRANDAASNLSGYSSIVNATTKAAADTTAPSAPTNLIASVISSTQINLNWTASTDNVSVTGYKVERCSGASCTTFAQIATPTATTLSDTGLTDTTSYSYRVRATDAAGNLSAYSSIASATTQPPPDTIAPTIPTGLTATVTSSTQINLSWATSTDNVGVTGYLIERCQYSACSNFAQINSSAITNYNDAGLMALTNYTYRIRAIDAANNISAYSNNVNATTSASGPTTYTYTYDQLGRITHVAGSDGSSIDYQYDADGNLTLINHQ